MLDHMEVAGVIDPNITRQFVNVANKTQVGVILPRMEECGLILIR